MDLAPSPHSSENEPETPRSEEFSGSIPTTWGHRGFVLIGLSFLVFECLFLVLYTNDFWFDIDIAPLGIPAVLVSMLITHFLLVFNESKAGCHFYSPVWKGRPPVIYFKWLSITDSGFTFGNRHIRWQAVDGLALTLLGNLLVQSRALCGFESKEPDVIIKFPLAVAQPADQLRFVEIIKARKQEVTLNKRLEKKLRGKAINAPVIVQMLGALFLFLVLLDVGNSTFSYLDMLKGYYQAELAARAGDMAEAETCLSRGDRILNNPPPISWVTSKLLRKGSAATGIHTARSEALFHMKRSDEAIEEVRKALKLDPESYRLHLRLARLLVNAGNYKAARDQIRQAVDEHKGSLLPRLYHLVLAANPEQSRRLYKIYFSELKDDVFGDQPLWPPGGNPFLHEVLYQEDAEFIFDRLIGRTESN